jgi:spore coat protein CotF
MSHLTAHEAAELHELLMSCVNSINMMALFLDQAEDPELQQMITRHFSAHVQDYNMKVEWARSAFGTREHLQVMPLDQTSFQPTRMGDIHPGSYPSVQPQVKRHRLDDRSIATGYLLNLKRAGREYAWSTFETATPQLRAFLEDAFRMNSHQAYEIWQYMARRGWYPVMPSPQNVDHTLARIYQQVNIHHPQALYNEADAFHRNVQYGYNLAYTSGR